MTATKLNMEKKGRLSTTPALPLESEWRGPLIDPAPKRQEYPMTSQKRWTRVFPIILVLALAAPAAVADLLPPVVSPAALADRLAAAPGNVVLLDARPAIKAYLTGHLPGAQTVVVDSFRSTAGGVPATIFPWETIHLVAPPPGNHGRHSRRRIRRRERHRRHVRRVGTPRCRRETGLDPRRRVRALDGRKASRDRRTQAGRRHRPRPSRPGRPTSSRSTR